MLCPRNRRVLPSSQPRYGDGRAEWTVPFEGLTYRTKDGVPSGLGFIDGIIEDVRASSIL